LEKRQNMQTHLSSSDKKASRSGLKS